VVGHLLSALLLWRLLGRLGIRLSWLGGLIFAIHPLAVESVAWISEQKNTLSLPLLLLSANAYINFDEAPGAWNYLRSILCFLAAMLCKSSVVMFPAVLILYVWWRHKRVKRSDLSATGPFFAISLLFGVITLYFQSHYAIGSERIEIRGMASRLASAGLALAFYAEKSILPLGLMPIYPRWMSGHPSMGQYWPWLVGCVVAGVLWWKGGRKGSRIGWMAGSLFAFLFFVVNLLPVVGFIPMSFMRVGWVSDHLAYISFIGLVGLAAAGIGKLWSRLVPRWRLLAIGGIALIVALLMVQSRAYAGVFRNEIGLWSFAADKNPGASVAHYSLANARVRAGQLNEAVPEYEEALRLRPDFAKARSNYGDALLRLGRTSDAAAQFEIALGTDPNLVPEREKLGNIRLAQGRVEDAIAEYTKALSVHPDYARGQGNLAFALALAGRLEEAVAHYNAALKLDPSNPGDWDQLGTVFAHLGRTAEAKRHYEQALSLKPDDPDAHNNLGLLLARMGRLTEAVGHFEAALRERPDFPAARRNLELARQALEGGSHEH
jgi:tetratricopeptide (TPR) repeat protein